MRGTATARRPDPRATRSWPAPATHRHPRRPRWSRRAHRRRGGVGRRSGPATPAGRCPWSGPGLAPRRGWLRDADARAELHHDFHLVQVLIDRLLRREADNVARTYATRHGQPVAIEPGLGEDDVVEGGLAQR